MHPQKEQSHPNPNKVCAIYILCYVTVVPFAINEEVISNNTDCMYTGQSDYFGTQVKVAFTDGNHYPGIIIGRDGKDGAWVTRFEDGTEDTCVDPANDKDYQIINLV